MRGLVRIGAALLALVSLAASDPKVFVQAVQLPKGWVRSGTIVRDLNGDGLPDLVVAMKSGPGYKSRKLRIYLQQKGETPFRQDPDPTQELEIGPYVTAFAVADVTPEPGEEVVLFSAKSAAAWNWRASGNRARFAGLLDCRFLFQLAANGDVLAYPAAAADLDGDKLDDLVIPEPDGYRIAYQERRNGKSDFERTDSLTVPADPKADHGQEQGAIQGPVTRPGQVKVRLGALELSAGAGVSWVRPPLLQLEESVPVPHLVDFDGDGKKDLVCRTASRVCVFLQHKTGFASMPDEEFSAPVTADRGRLLDVSFSTHFLDLDGDGKCDCVLFAGDQRSKDARTQVLVYVQGAGRGASRQTQKSPLFGPQGIPQQLLVIAGFAGAPEFVDVDGDGRKDLVLLSLRPDALDVLREKGGAEIGMDLYVYRNHGGEFSSQPDFTRRIPISLHGQNSLKARLVAEFLPDCNGDGVAELLVRDRRERIRVYPSVRRGRSFDFSDSPLLDLAVDSSAEVVSTVQQGAPVLFILEPGQILFVKFP